ncbi:MAG: hypothetical protein DMG30_03700 [Acidobacteria bacterium]|nr:MAG: hypothetical protein DMG30_03700 [Acidobacteriota bacterium]
MKEITASELLERARKFQRPPVQPGEKIPLDPMLVDSPSVTQIIERTMAATGCSREDAEDHLMRMQNLGEILTPEELADRLKVPVGWINEKRRPRCAHPLPALTNRPLRFDWPAIVTWLEAEAKRDAATQKSLAAATKCW